MPPQKPKWAVQAVLTGADVTKSLEAMRLTSSALASVMSYNVPAWHVLPHGRQDCTSCWDVTLDPVPPGTQRLVATAVLKDFVQGTLYNRVQEVMHRSPFYTKSGFLRIGTVERKLD